MIYKDEMYIILLLLTIVAVLLVFYLVRRKNIHVVEYNIYSDKITNKHRIVHITDLHCVKYGEKQCELIKLVNSLSPEILLFTGDMSEVYTPIDNLKDFMIDFKNRIPIYGVKGNHEDCLDYDVKDEYNKLGAKLLMNESIELEDNISIHGIDDITFFSDSTEYIDMIRSFKLDSSRLNILLAHRPEYIPEYAKCNFDITLHGHAHGGQVIIPGLVNGLFAPGQGLFPKYAGGEYYNNKTTSIVCRGLMVNEIPRVFNPPEIAVINIIPSELRKVNNNERSL